MSFNMAWIIAFCIMLISVMALLFLVLIVIGASKDRTTEEWEEEERKQVEYLQKWKKVHKLKR